MLSRSRAGERAAVELGVCDQREHVVARVLAPLAVVLASEPAELLRPWAAERQVPVLLALALERELADVLRLRVDEQPVAQLDQPGQVLVLQAEDAGEDADRDRRCDLVHGLELVVLEGLVEHVAHDARAASPRSGAPHGE